MLSSLLIAAVAVAAPHAEASPRSVELDVGQQKVLDFPGMARAAVGLPDVADIHPVNTHQLILLGKGEGHTTLLVWTTAGALIKMDLRVTRQTGEALEQALRKLMPGEDLTVTELNGKRVVQGRVITTADMDKLQVLVKDDADVVLFVTLDKSAQQFQVAQINNALEKHGFKNAHAELVGDRIFLEGHVEDEADSQKAALIAESITGVPVEKMP